MSQGYSFCIITDGKEPEKTRLEIESIQKLNMPSYEILIGGDYGSVPDYVIKVSMIEFAKEGKLGAMRNALCRIAKYDHLVVIDDDLLFHSNFYDGLKKFGEDYDVMSCRIINPDGSRFWDWKENINGKNILMSYDQLSEHISITGGFCVMKARVFKQVQWDDQRGFYKDEDVDFSEKLRQHNFQIRFNRFSTITHNDNQYYQVGNYILKGSGLKRFLEYGCRLLRKGLGLEDRY